MTDFKLEVVEHELQIGFDNMTVNDILEKLLPPDVEVPQGYETVGHIAHFNLKPKVWDIFKISKHKVGIFV